MQFSVAGLVRAPATANDILLAIGARGTANSEQRRGVQRSIDHMLPKVLVGPSVSIHLEELGLI
jgi:hypothetical protein